MREILKDKGVLIIKILLILLGLVTIVLILRLIGAASTNLFYPLLIIIIILVLVFAALIFYLNLLNKHKTKTGEPQKSKTQILKLEKSSEKSLADEEKKLFKEISERLKRV